MNGSLLGKKVGRIRVSEIIGKGGMGEVYAGFDEKLERKVALKAIRAEHRLDPEAHSRFLREAQVLSQMHHPNICQIYDYIEGDEGDLLVLEFIQGQSLGKAIRKGLTYMDKLAIAEDLARVLVVAHGRDIVHRDLKPDNVMIGCDSQVKVLDFGLSRTMKEEDTLVLSGVAKGRKQPEGASEPRGRHNDDYQTTIGTILGTLSYMSPEQARGEHANAASDIYSLGLVLQELFTGSAPYQDDLTAEERLRKAQKGETLPIEGIDGDLCRIVDRMKTLASGARPAAIDVCDRLRWIRNKPKRKARRVGALLLVAVLTALSAGLTYQWIRAKEEARRSREGLVSYVESMVDEQMTHMQMKLSFRDVKQGNLEAAIEGLQQALGGREERFSPGGDPVTADLHFEIACLRARLGDPEAAIASLRLAVKSGFTDPWIAKDPDLAVLRGSNAFDALVAEVLGHVVTAPSAQMAQEVMEEAVRKAEEDLRNRLSKETRPVE